MELKKCHLLLFGCETMRLFSTGLLLLIVFGSLEGSTIPHKRTVRALNATIQTHFNGTIQRKNPCTNTEVERSSYRGCHEFHHHSKESNWSDYTRKCATLISDFFHAISNLVTFKDRQSGTFDLNINTKVSHKTDGVCDDTKKPICPTPTVIVESTECEVLPSTGCDDLPREDTHSKGSEICSNEKPVEVDEEEKCSVGSDTPVAEEPQTAGSSLLPETEKCLGMSHTLKGTPEPTHETIPTQQSTQEVNPPEVKPQSVNQPETIPTYDNYPSADQTSETTNVESSVSDTYDDQSTQTVVKPDTTETTSAPKEDLYVDVSVSQLPGTDSAVQETPSDSKDYLSDYTSQTNEETAETQPSSSATQSDNDKVVPQYDGPSIEFSDKIALYNDREPQQKSSQTLPPTTQHYSSDTTTPSTFEIKSDYDVQDTVGSTQPTSPPQYQYDELQSSPAVTFAPVQPESENYVNQYDQSSSDLPTSSPPKSESTLEFSDQLAVYNIRQPQPESPPSSSLTNEPTSIQPPSLPESQSENYVNYEDGLVPSQLPTSVPPPKGEEPSVEFSDQLAVYNVRQPYSEPTSPQPASSEPQLDNYNSYEDETESNESTTSSFPSANVEPTVEFSDELAVYNIRTPTTAYPPSPYYTSYTSTQPSVSSETQSANYVNYEDETAENQSLPTPPPENVEPSIEFSDQLAVYNVRESLPGTTTPYPLLASSVQPSMDNYMNYDNEAVSNQIPTTSSPHHEEDQYLEYSDQNVYNVGVPLPGSTPLPIVPSTSIQPSDSQSDNYMNYDSEAVPDQTPTSPSPQPGGEQYVEYSDQLAVYNVREPLPKTTTSSPAVSEDIPSSFATTLPPLFSSYDTNMYDDQNTKVEPQPTSAPKLEEETYNYDEVSSQPQPSKEPVEYDGEYNEKTFYNQMSPFTTPAGNVYPTMMPSSEYFDNNGPESPSSDYSSSQGIDGFVSTSLPSSSFNNFELQYDSQPTSTLLPSEAQQDQVFSDQISDVREPQSDSSVSDGRISDLVTAISPVAESESSISYEDESYSTDSQQTVPLEPSLTNDYQATSSPDQPLPNTYDIYDEQSSTSENEAPVTSVNEPPQYPQFPVDVITTSPSSTEPENFGNYDDSQFSAEPQSTYPPIIEKESFANYEDNSTSTTGQAFVSAEPLSDNDSSEEGSSSEGEDEEGNGNEAVSNDQGLLPLSPNTFRPTVQIETTVNYADQTPFRPILLPSSLGPLQENNIVYDEGILGNETEPSALGGEEDNDSLNVSSELTKQNEGKESDSSTTLAPQLEFDTYYEETFKQPSSSDSPKINNYMIYEDDEQPSSPKSDLTISTISNDYTSSFFPSTPSFTQEMITTPPTTEPMPETYTDYEYSKTNFNSQTTFPPQTESVNYDDHSSQDQSLTQQQQQQSVDYAAYNDQVQSTSTPNSADQETIDITDQLSIYNVPENVLESSSPLSEIFTTVPPNIPYEVEFQPTYSPQNYDEQSSPSKDLNVDTYVSYEDTVPSSQSPTTTLQPNAVEPSLEYSDQLAVYNVRQPQPESPPFSSLTNEPTTIQPPFLPEQPENYVNYDQLPVSVSPPKGEDLKLTSTQSDPSESQPDNYDSYEDETESNESATSSSPTGNVEPFLQYSDEVTIYNVQSSPSPQSDDNTPAVTTSTLPPSSVYESVTAPTASPEGESESEEDYEDEIVSNDSSTTISAPKEEPSIEFTDQLAVYNIRQPSTASPLPSVSYVESSSAQPSIALESQPDNYVSYEDERPPAQLPTSPSPQPGEEQYLEYSDQLAVYNVREPLPTTTTSPPTVSEDIPSSFATTLPPLFSSNRIETYDDPTAGNEFQPTVAPETYDEPTSAPATSLSPTQTQPENYVNYENEELPTSSPLPKSLEPFVEYSDQLSIYNVRQPEYYSSSPSPVNLVTTTAPVEYTDSQTTSAPESESQTYDEPTSFPASSVSEPDIYTNYDEKIVSNEFPTSPYPSRGVEPSLEPDSQPASSSVAPPLSSSIEEAPFLQYSDQVSMYDDRQPDFETTPSSPSEMETVSSGAMSVSTTMPFPSGDSFQDYNSTVTSSDYESTPSLQVVPESQVTYDDYSMPKEESSPISPTSNLGQSQDFSVPPPNYSDEQESDYQSTSPSQSQDNYVTYEDQTVSSVPSVTEVEPSLEYSDQLAVYNVREPVFTSTPAPVVSENIPGSIITLPPSPLFRELTSPQPSPSESQSDSYENYEDETVPNEPSTALPPLAQTEPSVEYSDPLAPFNVLGPVIVPISDPVVNESVSSADVTTLPSSTSESDSDEDYEDETVSTPSPVTGYEPTVEVSDELSIYNVRRRPSEMTTPSPLSEDIPSGAVTTLAPSLPSDKFESYDYQPVAFESQPTFSPKDESQVYDPSTTTVPNTPSQPQDNYVNYESEVDQSMTTLRPSADVEPSLEYSDELAIYNVRSPSSSPPPLFNGNITLDTVSTFMPSPVYDEPTSAPSTTPEEQPDNYVNYEDQLPSNTFPITYSPTKEEPSMISSDPSINTANAQSLPSNEYNYDNQVEYADSPTVAPTELVPQTSNQPTSIGPLPSSQSQPEEYVNYEDETLSTSLPTSTSAPTQMEPSVEYSDELAVYNVREPLFSSTLPPVVTTLSPSSPLSAETISIQPTSSESESDSDDDYEDETGSIEPTTLPPVMSQSTVNTVVTTPTPSSSTSQSDTYNYEDYKEEAVSTGPSTTFSTPVQFEPSVEYSDQLAVYNVREPLLSSTLPPVVTTLSPSSLLSAETISIQPSSSELESDSDDDYEDETESNESPSTLSTPVQVQVEPSVEYSDELAVYNVREPLFSSTLPPVVTTLSPSSPLNAETISIQPSPSESESDIDDDYEDETGSIEPTTLPPVMSESIVNTVVTTPTPSSSTSQSDSYNYEDYKEEAVSFGPSTTLSTPVQFEPSVEYSDQLAIYNVRQPEYYSSSPSPLTENLANDIVTTVAPSLESGGFETYDNEAVYTDFQPTSSPQSDSKVYYEPTSIPGSSSNSDYYANYEDKMASNVAVTSASPPTDVGIEYSDELSVYNVREPQFSSTIPPVVTTRSPSSPLTAEPISIQPSESQSDSDDDYEDETESSESPTILPTPVQVQGEPSVEYSDQLEVYDVREPLLSSTLSPVVSKNIPSDVVTTLSPSSSLIVEQPSPQPSSSDSDSDEDYEDETVSTPSPVTGYEPSVEVSDELSIYNVRQRPSEMTTPSPFNNDVITNLMTTISPYFTFQESSSKDILNTTSQTTLPPEYESDMYDEQSSIQPSQSHEDDSQALSHETTPQDLLSETLNDSDEQTISNVIQSTRSPDLSNQLYSENQVEFQKVSFTTVQPDLEPSVTSESSAGQEFDYQPTLSPDYEAQQETTTTPPSSSQSQDNYVVYDDQTLASESITSSPVYGVEPSLEYSNDALLPETSVPHSTSTPLSSEILTETYTDYEGSTANSNLPSTLYDEPRNSGQDQTSTSQPQIVNYDYYSDQTQKPEESSTSPPTTEIETKITLTEFGPTLPPNFESQIFDQPNAIQQDNYDDYEDSTLSNQMPTSPSPQSDIRPSIQLSDELAVYNVRKAYFEPTSIQPSSSSEPQPDSYDTYEDQVTVNELSTSSPPQKVENIVTQPDSALEEGSQIYDEPTSSPTSQPQTDNYVNYDSDLTSNEPMTMTPSINQVEPSVEYSDELAVYNVREPLFSSTLPPVVTTLSPSSPLSAETISIQPSPSESESDSDDDYEDETGSIEHTTLPPVMSQSIVNSVVTTPASSFSTSQSDSYNYEDYKEETVSTGPSTTLSTPVQFEPSVEYSDELAVYNVREPILSSTLPPVVSENIPSSVVTTLSPSSPLSAEPISIQPSESQSDSDDDYEDETESSESSTTLPTPVQVQGEPSVEYSDQLEVYDVREPLLSSTLPPVVSENIPNSVFTTLSPSSPLIVEQPSPQPSSAESDSDEDYEDETVSTPSPVTGYEPSVEVSDELSIYNVRQRPSEMTTPSPFNNNVLTNLMTTISPYFTSSSNDYEGSTFQPSLTSEPEPEIYDQPYTSLPSSGSTENNYANYEDGVTSDDYSTTSSLPTEAEQSWSSGTPFEYPEQASVYNVRQRPSELSSSSLLVENLPDEAVSTTATPLSSNDFGSYDPQYDQNDESNPSEGESETNDYSVPTQNSFSASEPENYANYENVIVSNDLPRPTTDEQPSIEFSDQLAVYNIRQPSTASPLPSVGYVESSSSQPSIALDPQPDNYVSYEDERPPAQLPTSTSPQPGEEQYLEYSDQLAVYNVREPLPTTTTSPPTVSEDIASSVMTTSLPFYESEAITTQSSIDSQPDSYQDYEEESVTTVPPAQGIKTTLSNTIVTAAVPSLPSEGYETYDSQDEYTDVPTVAPTELIPQTSNQPTSIGPLPSSQSQPEEYVNYEDETPSTSLPTSTSAPTQMEPSVEYSDELAVYNVREPMFSSTLPPVVTILSPSSPLNAETISIQPSPSESESDSDDDYEDETESNESPTTLSTPVQVQVEPLVEYSDELAVYNVREPLFSSTLPPVVTTLSPSSPLSAEIISIQPSPSESESDSDDDYEDETGSIEPTTSLPVMSESIVNSVVTTSTPSSSTSQSDSYNYEDYKEEAVSFGPSTTLSTPVQFEPSVEYSDQLAIYNVRQPEYYSSSPSPLTENLANDLVTTVAPSLGSGGFETYDNEAVYTDFQPTSSPQSDSQVYHEPTSITGSSSNSDYYANYEDKIASNVAVTSAASPTDVGIEYSDELAIYNVRQPSTATPFTSVPDDYLSEMPTQRPVSDSDKPYIFSDQLSIVREPESDSQLKVSNVFTTLSPLTQTSVESEQDDYYTYEDRSQSFDSQTTLSPETETEYDEASTPLEPQSPSSARPLLETMTTTFQPLTEPQTNKTSTPSKQPAVSTFPPLYPFIPLNEPSNSLPVESKLVSEQQDQVISNQVVNSPPVPFALVPDQTNPSNEPDRIVIRDKL